MKHRVKNTTYIYKYISTLFEILFYRALDSQKKEEMSQKLTDNNISSSPLDSYTVLPIQMVTREAATRDRKQLERGKINILCREHGRSGG